MDELYPNEPQVTEADKQELREAILHAYPEFDFLYMRLEDKWGFRARNYFDMHRGHLAIANDLVVYALAAGKLLDLLGVTWADKPRNPKLAALAGRLLTNPAGVLAKYAPQPVAQPQVPATHQALEKPVAKRSTTIDLDIYAEGISRLKGALCRISLKLSSKFELRGTGFLIGRRHVLTNFHVMQDAIEGKLDSARIRFEFDYWGDFPNPKTLDVAAGVTWDVEHRPFSQSDLTASGEPAPGELDFALVKLAEDVAVDRPQLAWPIAPPIVSQRDLIFIGQHPQGEKAKIAFGEVLAYPGSGLRYRYDVTTEPGSSGSPVLTVDHKLVGLHHASDPKYDAKYNQGVPIWLIMDALRGEGIDLAAL